MNSFASFSYLEKDYPHPCFILFLQFFYLIFFTLILRKQCFHFFHFFFNSNYFVSDIAKIIDDNEEFTKIISFSKYFNDDLNNGQLLSCWEEILIKINLHKELKVLSKLLSLSESSNYSKRTLQIQLIHFHIIFVLGVDCMIFLPHVFVWFIISQLEVKLLIFLV